MDNEPQDGLQPEDLDRLFHQGLSASQLEGTDFERACQWAENGRQFITDQTRDAMWQKMIKGADSYDMTWLERQKFFKLVNRIINGEKDK